MLTEFQDLYLSVEKEKKALEKLQTSIKEYANTVNTPLSDIDYKFINAIKNAREHAIESTNNQLFEKFGIKGYINSGRYCYQSFFSYCNAVNYSDIEKTITPEFFMIDFLLHVECILKKPIQEITEKDMQKYGMYSYIANFFDRELKADKSTNAIFERMLGNSYSNEIEPYLSILVEKLGDIYAKMHNMSDISMYRNDKGIYIINNDWQVKGFKNRNVQIKFKTTEERDKYVKDFNDINKYISKELEVFENKHSLLIEVCRNNMLYESDFYGPVLEIKESVKEV